MLPIFTNIRQIFDSFSCTVKLELFGKSIKNHKTMDTSYNQNLKPFAFEKHQRAQL
jgi:hypothetical protein